MTGVATIHPDLRAACRAKLLATAGLPAAIAWEGEVMEDGFDGPFIREAFRPIFSQRRALGQGGTMQHRCTFNLTLHYPAGEGTLAIETAAGLILQAFAPGLSLTYGTATCLVQSAERMGLGQDPGYLSCPVIITLTAYTVT